MVAGSNPAGPTSPFMETPPSAAIPPPAQGSDKTAGHPVPSFRSFSALPFFCRLIVYLVKRDESGFVAAHAREVLNFHLSLVIYVHLRRPAHLFPRSAIPIFIVLGL